jgi:hypothetical protein
VLLEHFHDSSVLDRLEEHSSPVSHPPLSSKVPKSLNFSFRVSTLPMQHWPLSSQKTLWNSFSGGLALVEQFLKNFILAKVHWFPYQTSAQS